MDTVVLLADTRSEHGAVAFRLLLGVRVWKERDLLVVCMTDRHL